MAPTALYSAPVSSSGPAVENVAAISAKGPALAIGSLVTAQDGKHQSLIESLENNRQVERQMLDRLMDGGGSLEHPFLIAER
jgi:hypothetical protein